MKDKTSSFSLIAAAALLLPLACQPAPPTGVVLITIDTLRADHLGVYGYALDTSPQLDALAKESIVFTRAIAPAPWTLPSVATLFTSLYPSVHGATDRSEAEKTHDLGFEPTAILAEEFATLPEILRDAGFATAGFVRGAYPSSVYGFSQGFEHFEDNETYGTRFSVERLLAWLDREAPERFFIYLHTIEVHSPYVPVSVSLKERGRLSLDVRKRLIPAVREERERYRSLDPDPDYQGSVDGSLKNLRRLSARGSRVSPGEKERLVELYDRGIRYTDHWLGNLLTSLRERGLLERTILVVTSDHGEEFWEHGRLEHGRTYYDELLRIPLLVRVPGEGLGTVVDQQVGLIDVLPTILDIVGVTGMNAHTNFQGRSLRPLWRGESLAERPYFAESRRGSKELAMRTERWKLIGGGRNPPLLFDLWSDPRETENVCPQQPEMCLRLETELLSWREAMLLERKEMVTNTAPAAEPDPETLDQLKALGYID